MRDPEGNLLVFVQSGSEKPVASAAIPPNATSTRIIHVGFMVHDRDKEDAFWQTILGFRPYWHGGRNADVTDWVALQVPNGSDWIEYMLNPAPTPNLSQSGMSDHFSLGVTHMQDAVTALARNHCEGANCSKIETGLDGKVQIASSIRTRRASSSWSSSPPSSPAVPPSLAHIQPPSKISSRRRVV